MRVSLFSGAILAASAAISCGPEFQLGTQGQGGSGAAATSTNTTVAMGGSAAGGQAAGGNGGSSSVGGAGAQGGMGPIICESGCNFTLLESDQGPVLGIATTPTRVAWTRSTEQGSNGGLVSRLKASSGPSDHSPDLQFPRRVRSHNGSLWISADADDDCAAVNGGIYRWTGADAMRIACLAGAIEPSTFADLTVNDDHWCAGGGTNGAVVCYPNTNPAAGVRVFSNGNGESVASVALDANNDVYFTSNKPGVMQLRVTAANGVGQASPLNGITPNEYFKERHLEVTGTHLWYIAGTTDFFDDPSNWGTAGTLYRKLKDSTPATAYGLAESFFVYRSVIYAVTGGELRAAHLNDPGNFVPIASGGPPAVSAMTVDDDGIYFVSGGADATITAYRP